jgi:hypothetical protein
MRRHLAVLLLLLFSFAVIEHLAAKPAPPRPGARAEMYFWKAKPGKLNDYNRYIREYAEPIDHEAQRRGAFISVTTYLNAKPDAPWTHMRVFLLRDAAQQQALAKALDDAKLRLHPDEQERNRQAAYAETLRDLVGHESAEVMP